MKTSLIAPVEANMRCAKSSAKKCQLRQVTFNVVNHQKGPQVTDVFRYLLLLVLLLLFLLLLLFCLFFLLL